MLRAYSLLLCTEKSSEVRLFLRKRRAKRGCPVDTRSEKALSKSKRLTEPDGCPTFAAAYVVPKTTFFECFRPMTHCYLLTKNNGRAAPGFFGPRTPREHGAPIKLNKL
jgi:hypothetical protein